MSPCTAPTQTTKRTKCDCALASTGVGMIEAIVVISIMSAAFAAILAATVFFLRGGIFAADKVQAMYLAEEGVEAVRFLRDQGFAANIDPLIDAGPRYIDPAAGGWTVTAVDTPIFGKFSRTIELKSVYRRNSDDDIVPATSGDPKTIDDGTAYLTVSVNWGSWSETITTYVADLYEN